MKKRPQRDSRGKQELLREPLLKIQRAEHHINDLDGQIKAFLAQKPFRLIRKVDVKRAKVGIYTETDKPIPDVFSLIIGDAVHNLCAALDLTIFAMVGDRCPSPQEIAFPFSRKQEGLEGSINRTQVKFAGTEVVATVKRLKPYPNGHEFLSGLHSLDLRDKHRLLILMATVPTITADDMAKILPGFPGMGQGIMAFHYDTTVKHLMAINFKEGLARNIRRKAAKGRPFSKEDTEIQPTFVISFGEGQPFARGSVIATLRKLTDATKEAVSLLADAYLSPRNKFP